MKILSVFALSFFWTTTTTTTVDAVPADLDDCRTRTGIKSDELLGVVASTCRATKFDGFRKSLYAEFKEKTIERTERNHVDDDDDDALTRVNNDLEIVVELFVRHSYKHATCNVLEYLESVMERLNDDDDDGAKTAEALGLPGDYEQCELTMFYDFGYSVEALMESTYYFRKLDDAGDAVGEWAARADGYRDWVGGGGYWETAICPLPGVSAEQYTGGLTAIRRTIADFSAAFCPRWRPLVGHFLAAADTDVAPQLRIPTGFVAHVFENEKCSITFELFDIMKSQSYRINSWDCGRILETDEYIREPNEGHKKTEQTGRKRKFFGKMLNCAWLRRSAAGPAESSGEYDNERSLVSLKNQLSKRNNNYYLNAVMYYNVAAEVFTLAAIKEGTKILKRIGRAVTSDYCAGSPEEKIVGDMLETWTALSAFKSLFDRFLVLVEEIKRVDFADDSLTPVAINAFRVRVNQILIYLRNPGHRRGDSRTRQNCLEVVIRLGGLTAATSHRSPITAKTEKYAFTQPILNLMQLYRFSEEFFL